MLGNISSLLAVLVITFPRTVEAFSYPWCLGMVNERISQNQTTINGNSIYFSISTDGKGTAITYDACRGICGSEDNSIVNDWAARLCSWVLPIIILTFSVQLPPLARSQKLWAVMRLMGDPIGSVLWMMDELRFYGYCLAEGAKAARTLDKHLHDQDDKYGTLVVTTSTATGDRTRQDVARNCARLIHAFSKSIPGGDPKQIRKLLKNAITDMSSFPDPEERRRALEEFCKHINEYGEAISGLKSRSTLKSLVAVGGFLFPVVIALIPALSPPASGAMLPPILILSPLLLIVLLNGAIGEYSNLKSLSKVLRDFRDNITASLPQATRNELEAALSPTVNTDDTNLLRYIEITNTQKRHILEGILLLIFPLGIASAGIAIGTAPAFFNDRHFVLIAIFVAWMGSWAVTCLATRHKESRFRRLLVVVTHFTVALFVTALLAATTCGWLGGCKMWTGYYRYGPREARMPLNLTEIFKDNGRRVYPALAAVCLSLNLIAFAWLRFGIFRDAFGVITGKEAKRGANIAPDLA